MNTTEEHLEVEEVYTYKHGDGDYGLTMRFRDAHAQLDTFAYSPPSTGNNVTLSIVGGMTRADMVELANKILDAAAKLEG